MSHYKIRQAIKQACLQLSPSFQEQAAGSIIKKLLTHPLLQTKKRIGVYYPFGHEINIKPWFMHAWAQGHHCYLPITVGKQLIFGLYTDTIIVQPNRWGIIEPQSENNLLKPEALDIVLTPLVAFDDRGYRLGRGQGYYDRTFSFLLQTPRTSRPYLIGLAYSIQQVDRIIPASWDVPLNEVITETQCYAFNYTDLSGKG